MSDSEDLDELEQNQDVQNISVFRKREKIHANDDQLIDMDPLKKLNYMLTCPICLDIFQEPVYVKGCSHRFCKECIEKAIRSSKMKQCPTCRRIIGTKRLLRVDFNVQEIINLIYGDISKFLELKQSNDELLIQKTYSQLANSDGATRKRRRQFNTSTTEKAQDNQQQSSPTFSSIKEDKGVTSNSAYKNSSNQQDQISNFSSAVKRRLPSNSNQGSSQQSQGQKNNEKGAQSQNEQPTTRKRKFDNLGESGNKKGDEYIPGHVVQKKKYFEEEIKEKQVEESLRKHQQESSLTSINGASLLNIGSSSSKSDRAFINIQIKVVPYDKLQKQFDFNILKMDWTLSLDDITKLICQKLNINYQKYKPYIKFYVKSSAEESSYHPLEDKTQIIKSIDNQFWSTDSNKQKYIRPYNKDEQAKNITTDYIHQKAAQNRILFYIIEHKDVNYTN
ncbi:zinc finger, C3HC4 type (RING finger) protein (macronuclear) [Tetrahymena thermophila SB210]|uniref:RING-type E3 ubiquitin transferase n=1 Tax=Tetrahymena thermophila (strain SB210) TaxID=312017 RepID=Q22U80_TETTS|nr:zinc finger, C3HC4 type (RING finger) protein [Tetrahymena thermophila SB210]EAR88807.2 zinc finger, C3HC4 type (RING finger) protein [Tetrahymena thermophila SB210]|eukprot:XP_001009052.2 zinc finger, C3HC4 type (RING finger) protein [Tetrahymena thermophila SB210]